MPTAATYQSPIPHSEPTSRSVEGGYVRSATNENFSQPESELFVQISIDELCRLQSQAEKGKQAEELQAQLHEAYEKYNLLKDASAEKDIVIQRLKRLPESSQMQPNIACEDDEPYEFTSKEIKAKPRIELLAQLLENCGCDFNTRGNKANAMRLIAKVLDLGEQTVANYLSDRNISKAEHGNSVNDINHLLGRMKVDKVKLYAD